MLRDVEFFKSKLGNMDGFGDTGERLVATIKSMPVTTIPVPANLMASEPEEPREPEEPATQEPTIEEI